MSLQIYYQRVYHQCKKIIVYFNKAHAILQRDDYRRLLNKIKSF